MADITDEMVEKAAHAHANIDGYDWDQVSSFWQGRYRKFARAILPAALAGRTVVDLPEPDGMSYEGDPIWGAHVDYEDVIFACVNGGRPEVAAPIGAEPLPADVAEMFGLRLLAAARTAKQRASESSGDGAQNG